MTCIKSAHDIRTYIDGVLVEANHSEHYYRNALYDLHAMLTRLIDLEAPAADIPVILAQYHDILPSCERVFVLNPARKKRVQKMMKMARGVCKNQGWEYDARKFWGAYFGECAKDEWLAGKVPYPARPAWKQNLETLINENRFASIMDNVIANLKRG